MKKTIKKFKNKILKNKIKLYFADQFGEIGGPNVRFKRLNQFYKNYKDNFNLIYTMPGYISMDKILAAKKKGIKIIQHINSFYHKAYREDFKKRNKNIENLYNIVDAVVFGSEYVQNGVYKFFGKRGIKSKIIYNSVDTNFFKPQNLSTNSINILCMGNHYIRHRIEPLIKAMPFVNEHFSNCKLMIVGPLISGEGIFNCNKNSFLKIIDDLNLKNVEFYDKYTQEEAPNIYNNGSILVHLKHMDWTPNTVVESLACGTPVLHCGNGGMNELVKNGGLSLNIPQDWDNIHFPEPKEIADKILLMVQNLDFFSQKAREVAINHYSLKNWNKQHKNFFKKVLIHEK